MFSYQKINLFLSVNLIFIEKVSEYEILFIYVKKLIEEKVCLIFIKQYLYSKKQVKLEKNISRSCRK